MIGSCGKSLDWILYADGSLFINGVGEMDDYLGDQFSKNRPVYEDYAKAIGDVVNDYYRDYNYVSTFFGCSPKEIR